jgi:hypothetical protein
MAIAPFLFQNVFQRIIEVGWGQGIYLIIVADVSAARSVEGAAPPIPEIRIQVSWRDLQPPEDAYRLDLEPRDPTTPQPPDFDPVPDVEEPPTQEMKAFYKVWSVPKEETDDSSTSSAPPGVVIEPDVVGAWLGPGYIFWHPSEDDALAYIENWRSLNPAWASIGWIIWPSDGYTVGDSSRVALYASYFKVGRYPGNRDDLPPEPSPPPNLARVTVHLPDAQAEGGGINGTLYFTIIKFDADNNEEVLFEEEVDILSFDELENLTIFDTFVFDIAKGTGELTKVSP